MQVSNRVCTKPLSIFDFSPNTRKRIKEIDEQWKWKEYREPWLIHGDRASDFLDYLEAAPGYYIPAGITVVKVMPRGFNAPFALATAYIPALSENQWLGMILEDAAARHAYKEARILPILTHLKITGWFLNLYR